MKPGDSIIRPDILGFMWGVAHCAPPGDFVEVGVYCGGSARYLYEVADRQGRRLYLYDTFTGIPYAEPVDSHAVGDFHDGASESALQDMMPKAVIVRGVFPTAGPIPETIAFAHMDCDQRKSYRDGLAVLLPRLVHGGRILCDDWSLPGAQQAIREAVDSTGFVLELHDYRATIWKP